MARLGAFDPQLVPAAWFDIDATAEGWFTDELIEASSSGSTQTLTPGLFSNSQTFYSPTVTPGAVTLTPGIFSNSSTFYAATATPGAVTLTPGLFTNSETFFAPTVTLSGGTQTLTAGLFSNAQTFYAPTVTPGAVTVSPGLLTNSQTFYAPTVYDPASVPASSIRFDISTGKLVKILSPAVCISF